MMTRRERWLAVLLAVLLLAELMLVVGYWRSSMRLADALERVARCGRVVL